LALASLGKANALPEQYQLFSSSVICMFGLLQCRSKNKKTCQIAKRRWTGLVGWFIILLSLSWSFGILREPVSISLNHKRPHLTSITYSIQFSLSKGTLPKLYAWSRDAEIHKEKEKGKQKKKGKDLFYFI